MKPILYCLLNRKILFEMHSCYTISEILLFKFLKGDKEINFFLLLFYCGWCYFQWGRKHKEVHIRLHAYKFANELNAVYSCIK